MCPGRVDGSLAVQSEIEGRNLLPASSRAQSGLIITMIEPTMKVIIRLVRDHYFGFEYGFRSQFAPTTQEYNADAVVV